LQAAGVLAVCATLAAGCGGGDDGSASTSAAPSTQAAGSGGTVKIADFKYDPATITVNAGEAVDFTNEDGAAHTATADDSSFDTDTLDKGDTAEVKIEKPGKYAYYCRFHAFMKGEIVVR
jgi:plastocyanin